MTEFNNYRDHCVTKAYNEVTGQDDEEWNPDKTLESLQTLWIRAFEAGKIASWDE